MELIAVIKALENVAEDCMLVIYTDSKYVINGITNWIKKWKKNKWTGSNNKQIKNIDLWKRLDVLTTKKDIHWKWVKAHSGVSLNEEVDFLAKKEAEKFTN